MSTTIPAGKPPPYINNEAERALLACILIAPDIAPEVVKHVVAGDFYEPKHDAIMQAVEALVADDKLPDVVVLDAWLSKHRKLKASGGDAYVHELVNSCPNWMGWEQYAEIVRETASGELSAPSTCRSARARSVVPRASGSLRNWTRAAARPRVPSGSQWSRRRAN